jgi:GNAT superfamily N-acetyltransferase
MRTKNMTERFQDCTVRQAVSPQLRWKVCWIWLLKEPIILGGLLLLVCLAIATIQDLIATNSIAQHQNLASVLPVFYIYILVCFGLLLLAFSLVLSQRQLWILMRKEKIIAVANFSTESNYSFLIRLKVFRDWRNQGFGSYFMRRLCVAVPKPIYLLPAVTEFYTKLGFSFASANQLPKELKYGANKMMVYGWEKHD